MKHRVLSQNVTYELHSLGWKAFQDLCLTITREIWGQTIQGFCETKDGGRDGAFYGTWTNKDSETFFGSFTVQCKHTGAPNKYLSVSNLNDEFNKAKRLAAKGLADNYFLLTNYRISGVSDETIVKKFEAIPKLKKFRIYNSDWISQVIHESKRLRMLVPRVYGLGDLTQILNTNAYNQAQAILYSLEGELQKFVITDAYKRSVEALQEHGFVFLLGEPACGKSTIAAALSLCALDQWEASTIKLLNITQFHTHWQPDEEQLFWVDDVFGATQLDYQGANDWNKMIPAINAAIQKKTKIILTSRNYIFTQALSIIKTSAFPLLENSQVIIKVEDLSASEREQILYNHMKLGKQPKEIKTKIKKYLPAVARHYQFKPEVARRLANPLFTKNLAIHELHLNSFVENQTEFLEETIRTMDKNCRAAMALIFSSGGKIAADKAYDENDKNIVELLGGAIAETREALTALEGAFMSCAQENGQFFWKFKHPTIRDAFGSLISKDRGLLEIFLKGMPVENLINEVCCGNVSTQGIKVIVPDKYFRLICNKLAELLDKGNIYYFLQYRCSDDFIRIFLAIYPHFLTKIQACPYLSYCTEVKFAARVYGLGLLPEGIRKNIANDIKKLSLSLHDAGFIAFCGSILTDDDVAYLTKEIGNNIKNDFTSVLSAWKSNYDHDNESASEYFSPLKDALDDYKNFFSHDKEIQEHLSRHMKSIEAIIEELDEDEDSSSSHSPFTVPSTVQESDGTRSIFDDVDV